MAQAANGSVVMTFSHVYYRSKNLPDVHHLIINDDQLQTALLDGDGLHLAIVGRDPMVFRFADVAYTTGLLSDLILQANRHDFKSHPQSMAQRGWGEVA